MPRVRVALVVLAAMIAPGCAAKPAAPPATEPQGAAPAAPPAPAPAPPPSVQATSPPATAPVAPAPPAAPAPAPTPVASRPPAPAAAPAAPATAPATKTVYIKVGRANFREAAGSSGKILRVLRRGARLEVLETRNDWLRVRLDDGPEGWVAQSVTSDTAP